MFTKTVVAEKECYVSCIFQTIIVIVVIKILKKGICQSLENSF